MTAWVAVGLIGGGTAFASRLCSLSRLIGAGIVLASLRPSSRRGQVVGVSLPVRE